MLMIANVLALALVAADEPKATKTPTGARDAVEVGRFFVNDREIRLVGLETDDPRPAVTPPPEARSAWHLSLPEAIRIGLGNSEILRVVSPKDGPAGLVIAPIRRDASTWGFKAAVMAHVRSIEQQYWALAQRDVALRGRETAVRLTEEILKSEKAGLDLGRSSPADIAEAERQLENGRLRLVSAASDRTATERQLRNLLGLPAGDDRRIVPETAPTEARLEPEWEAALAAMLETQPDIALQRQFVGMAEFKAILEGEDPTLPPDRREASRQMLEKQQAFLRQVTQQASRSLTRFFHEVDATHDQFQTARRLRKAAQDRLEAQRAFRDEGRVALDRLLDAINQHADAIEQEARYKFTYNTTIAALEEAKGTLLARDGITVIDRAPPGKAEPRPGDEQVVPATFQAPAPPATPAPVSGAATTYKLRAKLGGIRMWEIELEINRAPAAPPTGPAR